MAAYAALLSLSHSLRQILHSPPLKEITIPREQIKILREKVNFLVDFLETSPITRIDETEDLQRQITDVAYEAEDMIETNVVDQIRGGKNPSLLLEGIQTAVEKFLSIEKELMKIRVGVRCQQSNFPKTASSTRSLPDGEIIIVGLERHLNEIMAELAADESNLRIIPIVGMGGIGKTTLAKAVYNSSFIVEHFDICAWVTVSQEYSVGELFLRLLAEITKGGQIKQESSSDDEIEELVYKGLFGRKYLIVLDDMWDIQAWEKLKMYLPYNDNGSRVLVTTRLSNVADEFGSCVPYKMDFLDEEQSWDLLREKIFGEEYCPVELEEIGKNIAKRCGGLPLALTVIGGLLSKSERTRENWEYAAGDVTSILNHENDEQLMEILLLSYNHLPVYLKPCLLYLVVFPEDVEIHVSTLIRLWVAEGLIKYTMARCLEEVAHEYLEDLISRNLILVDERGSSGKVKFCMIHDMVRDMCTVQAEKENFIHIANFDNPKSLLNIETKRCLSFSSTTSNWPWLSVFGWRHKGYVGEASKDWMVEQIIHGFKLLKVVHVNEREIQIDIIKFINLRYVVAESVSSLSSMSLSWNLQTLVVHDHIEDVSLPDEIWQMTQLRHIKMAKVTLPDPPPDDQNVIVLENLQTLQRIQDLKFTEKVLGRIPNVKKLQIKYYFGSPDTNGQGENYFCLANLVRLKKLESLEIIGADQLWRDVAFPISLKKLRLENCEIPWGDLSIVGLLPNLEVLKLNRGATKGEKWNPVEGEFCRLKFLLIDWCELNIWEAENYHFPCLERLVLIDMNLEEIPVSFAEILTLKEIVLRCVCDSVWTSAKEISEQQELLGYEPLKIRYF